MSRAGAQSLGQMSSPDAVSGPSSPDAHYSDTSLVRKMQRNAGEKEKTKRPVQKQTVAGGKILKNPVSSDASLKLITV